MKRMESYERKLTEQNRDDRQRSQLLNEYGNDVGKIIDQRTISRKVSLESKGSYG